MDEGFVVQTDTRTRYVELALSTKRVPQDYDVFTVVSPTGEIMETFSALDYGLDEAKAKAQESANNYNLGYYRARATQLRRQLAEVQAKNARLEENNASLRMAVQSSLDWLRVSSAAPAISAVIQFLEQFEKIDAVVTKEALQAASEAPAPKPVLERLRDKVKALADEMYNKRTEAPAKRWEELSDDEQRQLANLGDLYELVGLGQISQETYDKAVALAPKLAKDNAPVSEGASGGFTGIVSKIRKIETKNLEQMAILQINGNECIAFPRTWQQYRGVLESGKELQIIAKEDYSKGYLQFIIEHAELLYDETEASVDVTLTDAEIEWLVKREIPISKGRFLESFTGAIRSYLDVDFSKMDYEFGSGDYLYDKIYTLKPDYDTPTNRAAIEKRRKELGL
jgi:hypothetical protein